MYNYILKMNASMTSDYKNRAGLLEANDLGWRDLPTGVIVKTCCRSRTQRVRPALTAAGCGSRATDCYPDLALGVTRFAVEHRDFAERTRPHETAAESLTARERDRPAASCGATINLKAWTRGQPSPAAAFLAAAITHQAADHHIDRRPRDLLDRPPLNPDVFTQNQM